MPRESIVQVNLCTSSVPPGIEGKSGKTWKWVCKDLLPLYFLWLSKQSILTEDEKAMLYMGGLFNFREIIREKINNLPGF